MSVVEGFAASYAEARERFCAAAAAAGAGLRSWRCPAPGPEGEPLFLDVARVGPQDATKVLVLLSGTHGIEGYGGSGVQISWLRKRAPRAVPADTSALLVHAVNPHGFAWGRRVNEENVDLNRNCIDHSRRVFRNEGYLRLAEAITPVRWDEASLAQARQTLADYAAEHGERALQQAMTGGQYSHPDGIFFGGQRPAWSNVTLRRVAREELAHAHRVAVIDVHTGLGPFGHGEILDPSSPGTPQAKRTRAWFGDEARSIEAGDSASTPVLGVVVDVFSQEAPFAETTCIGLEFGTHPLDEVLYALRQDNWSHFRGDPGSPSGREAKAYLRERFYPADDLWKEMIWKRADDVIARALDALARG